MLYSIFSMIHDIYIYIAILYSIVFDYDIYIYKREILKEILNATSVLGGMATVRTIPYPRANEPVVIPPRRTGGSFLRTLINGRNNFRITHSWTLCIHCVN